MPRLAVLSSSAGGVALAAVAGAISAEAGWPFLAMCLLLPVVWRYPLPSLLLAFLLFEEVNPKTSFARNSPYLVSFGHEFYTERLGPFSLALWLVFLATAASLCRFHPRISPLFWHALIVCSIYCGLFVMACLYWKVRPVQIVSLLAPQVALLGALIVGFFALSDEAQRRAATYCIAFALPLKLIFAAAILAQSPTAPDGTLQISFYDTAFPTAVAAILFGIAFRNSDRRRLVFAAIAFLIVILSMRRSLWLACLLFCILVALFNPKARRRLRRPLIVVVAFGVLSLFIFPDYVEPFINRFTSGVAAALGGGKDASSAGHILDLEVGLDAALSHPWIGVGPYGQPIPGLVVQEALYVHNELLQAWLRFGALGLVAVVLFTSWSCLVALRILKGRFGYASTAGAVMLILTPLNAITAPFLTTTLRWPFFCGIALSYVLGAKSLRREDELEPRPSTRVGSRPMKTGARGMLYAQMS